MSTYYEKLRSPQWQRKRLEIMERDSFTCQCCETKEKNLQIHHVYYLPNKKPWEYDNESLITLCCDCHDEITARTPRYMMKSKTPSLMMVNTHLLDLSDDDTDFPIVVELAWSLHTIKKNGDYGALRHLMVYLNEQLNKDPENAKEIH